ncbi:hypothetical protein KCG44_10270 [Pacificimonas sp. WHA3]|uniref:Lipoprotein n=1 Tax=Pacificimonas pallii TaxID=2827236 RepID=A0ABS6SFP5_9SPHN|nr:hypothetical protein [Pacificimonas pallii]MBV7257166.1 hypothetical protein [Pacificimonas pallii]
MRRPVITRAAAVALAAMSLQACGMNALRIESASTVGTRAGIVADVSRDALRQIEARRQQAFVTLVASDLSCEPVNPLMILVPTGAAIGKTDVPLCWGGGGDVPAGYEVKALDFGAFPADAVQPTVDLIAAIAAYGGAMAKIAEQPNADIAADIADAIDLATRAEAHAAAIGLTKIRVAGRLSSDQVETAANLIALLRDLQRERRQVRDARRLYAERGAAMGETFARLKRQLRMWEMIAGEGADQSIVTSLQRAYRNERAALSFEERQSLVTMVRGAALRAERAGEMALSVAKALDELQQANDALGRQLMAPSRDDAAQAAMLSRQRIGTALDLIVDAVSAWKGF